MGAISADSHKFRIDRVGSLGDPAKNIFIESEYNIRLQRGEPREPVLRLETRQDKELELRG
jgi:hypothetical protein